MHFKFEDFLFCFFVFVGLKYGSAKRERNCASNEKCIKMNFCPEIFELFKAKKDVARIRRSICGFSGTRARVCCKSNLNLEKRNFPESCGRVSIRDRIIGGMPVQVGAYPWNVALGYTERGHTDVSYNCGGTIISPRYVLTAAHCLDKKLLGRNEFTSILIGATNLYVGEDCIHQGRNKGRCYRHLVAGHEHIVMHPKYNQRGYSSDDIALIRLNLTLDFKDKNYLIEPICLPSNGFDYKEATANQKPIAAGWGLTANADSSNVMRSVAVPVLREEKCIKEYRNDFVSKQICAGSVLGMDSCKGDSGGALVVARKFGPPFTQFAIVSYGTTPCGSTKPSVYTSVADYMPWIKEHVN